MDIFTGEGVEETTGAGQSANMVLKSSTSEAVLPWVEKYRGHDLDSIVLPKQIRTAVENAIKLNSFNNIILHSGSPGTGKTSLARAIPEMLGTECRFLYGKRDAEILEEIEEYKLYKTNDGKPRFVVIDEADKARNADLFFRNLQSTIESSASTLRFILTCNDVWRIPDAVRSRCYPIEMAVNQQSAEEVSDYKNQIFNRLKHIVSTETAAVGGTYDKNTIIKTITACYPDIREMIATLHQSFLMNGGSVLGEPPVIGNDTVQEFFNLVVTQQSRALRYFISDKVSNCMGMYIPFIEYVIENVNEKLLIEFGKRSGVALERAKGQIDQEIALWCYGCEIMDLFIKSVKAGLPVGRNG